MSQTLHMPDGTVITDVPDGVDPRLVMQLYAAKMSGEKPAPDVVAKATGDYIDPLQATLISLGRNMDQGAAGIRQMFTDPPPIMRHLGGGGILGPESGLAAALAPKIASVIDRADTAMGITNPPIDPETQEANAKVYESFAQKHPFSNFAGNVIYALGSGGTPAGQGLLAGIAYGTPGQRLARAAITYGAASAADKLGEIVSDRIPSSPPLREVAKQAVSKGGDYANDQTLETIERARKLGLALPPTMVNPSVTNRALEGISGKIQTAQALSVKNQPVVNGAVKEALGIPADESLSADALQALRQQAGQAYDAVANVGALKVDPQFQEELGKAAAPYLVLKGSFPNSVGSKEIEGIVKDFTGRPTLDSGAVVRMIRYLRQHGYANAISQDPSIKDLGNVQLSVQRSLEDLIDRNLQATGRQGLLTAYRAARQLIAKSYSVQNALEESTGNVVAGKLAQQLGKGKPLSGDLETIARAAQAFPKAFQNVKSSMPGISPLDVGLSEILAAAHGGFGLMSALPFVRPIVRNVITSLPYQSAMVFPRQAVSALAGAVVPPVLGTTARGVIRDAIPFVAGLLGGAVPNSTPR